MDQQVLIERLTPKECNLIQETSTEGNKELYLSGVFMQAEQKNRNGRTYPLNEMQNAVTLLQETIKERGNVMGELDHPSNLVVSLDRVSHLITEVHMKGNDVYGKAKIIDTPCGIICKQLLEAGVQLGVSSRGAGAVNESGNVSGFQVVTIDIVANPSANANPTAVYEGFEGSKQGQKVITLAESVVHDDAAQKYLKKEILKFLSSMSHGFTKK